MAEKKEKENKKVVVQADDLISFRQFAKKSGAGDGDDVSFHRFHAAPNSR
jgi:coatomer subunit beta